MATIVAKSFTRDTSEGPWESAPREARLWSNPLAWDDYEIPGASDDIELPSGSKITMDASRTVGVISGEGQIHFTSEFEGLTLTAASAIFEGTGGFIRGTVENPVRDIHIVINGIKPATMAANNGLYRAMHFMDDSVMTSHIRGTPSPPWTKLGETAEVDDDVITVMEDVTNWEVGDTLVIGKVNYYAAPDTSHECVITAIDGRDITIDPPCPYKYYGRVQYATNNGSRAMHLSGEAVGWSEDPEAPFAFPDGFDETTYKRRHDIRACVANVTRRATISAPNDDLWQADGWGVHIMVMADADRANVCTDGTAIIRGGQAGHLGRYPIHHHMRSYANYGNGSAAITDLSSAVTLSAHANTTLTVLWARGVALRYTTDGSTPTASVGTLIAAYTRSVPYAGDPEDIKVIQCDTGGAVDIQYFSGDGSFIAAIPEGTNTNNGLVIWKSSQRGFVTHGTHNLIADGAICYDGKGHQFFEEDGSEIGTKLPNCLAIKFRAQPNGNNSFGYPLQLQPHEGPANFRMGPAGFWITSPATDHPGAMAVDGQGPGFWWPFPFNAHGLSSLTDVLPNNTAPGDFSGITVIACSEPDGDSPYRFGMVLADHFTDSIAPGISQGGSYDPTNDGLPPSGRYDERRVFIDTLTNVTIAFCERAYDNFSVGPSYRMWSVSDCRFSGLSGVAIDKDIEGTTGFIENGILSGPSLADTGFYEKWEEFDANWAPGNFESSSGGATYHLTLLQRRMTIINQPIREKYVSGAQRLNDFYIEPVVRGYRNCTDMQMLNSKFAFVPLPPIKLGVANCYWAFSGAIEDVQGLFGGTPGKWWTYDDPFFTHYATGIESLATDFDEAGDPGGSNGKAVDGPFSGMTQVLTSRSPERPNNTPERHLYECLDENLDPVGEWDIGDGLDSILFPFMHHAALYNHGRFRLTFPDDGPTSTFYGEIQNMRSATDWIFFGLSFDHAPSSITLYSPGYASVALAGTGASAADVYSGAVDRYWYDSDNDMLWAKLSGTVQEGNPYANYLYGHNLQYLVS